MITTFCNVTISIDAATPAEAYTQLCDALKGAADLHTDTYTVEDHGVMRDTLELFPSDGTQWARDWIVTRVRRNLMADSCAEYPLLVCGVNLTCDGDERYFEWRVTDVYDPRYDIGNAVIDDDVPLALLQECRQNG